MTVDVQTVESDGAEKILMKRQSEKGRAADDGGDGASSSSRSTPVLCIQQPLI
jgi:hypothetical protein